MIITRNHTSFTKQFFFFLTLYDSFPSQRTTLGSLSSISYNKKNDRIDFMVILILMELKIENNFFHVSTFAFLRKIAQAIIKN